MRKSLKVSALQMLVTSDVAQNEKRIVRGIERAYEQDSRFLVTPEGALSGYHAAFDCEEVASATARVVACARAARVGLLLGTCHA